MAKSKKDGGVWLSHTAIEQCWRCPRCFWLQQKKGIKPPEGIVSRLANRFDGIIKKYFQQYRQKGELPPFLKGQIEGTLERPFTERYYFHYDEKYGFLGKLDECIINPGGLYVPVDHKTSSSDPREKETLGAYQNQLDEYPLLLESSGKPCAGFGYLIYYFPDVSENLHDGVKLIFHVVKLKTNAQQAKERIKKAVEVLEEEMPKPSKLCDFCAYRQAAKEFED